MDNKDTLGDRIKRYENVSKHNFTPRTPLFIRIDGRAFHTFTRGAVKPFDQDIINAMTYAARETAKEMSGFKLAYVQSDEATFMLTDYDTFETQGWFDYELNKIVSISASAFTAHFNYFWHIRLDRQMATAQFDSRAFTVPIDDAPNVFIWRQRDWERNSVQMLARAHYSQKEVQGLKNHELLDKLKTDGKPQWQDLNKQLKYGTFIHKDDTLTHEKVDYNSLKTPLGIVGQDLGTDSVTRLDIPASRRFLDIVRSKLPNLARRDAK